MIASFVLDRESGLIPFVAGVTNFGSVCVKRPYVRLIVDGPVPVKRKRGRPSATAASKWTVTSITYLLPELGYSRVRNEINEFTFSLGLRLAEPAT